MLQLFRLMDILPAVLDARELEPLPPECFLPCAISITLGQTVALWKTIVFYKQQHM